MRTTATSLAEKKLFDVARLFGVGNEQKRGVVLWLRWGRVFAEAAADHAGGDGGVGRWIDEDEAAGCAVVCVGIEEDGTCRRYLDDADVVHAERVDCLMLESLDVGAVKNAGDASVERLRAVLEQIGLVVFESRPVEPYEGCFEFGSGLRGTRGVGDDVAAADVQLFFKGECDGLRCDGLVQVAVEGGDGGDSAACGLRASATTVVAFANGAGGDLTSEAAIAVVRADDALDRQAECFVRVESAGGDLLEMFEQRRTDVPGGARTGFDDVVAVESADRYGDETRLVPNCLTRDAKSASICR